MTLQREIQRLLKTEHILLTSRKFNENSKNGNKVLANVMRYLSLKIQNVGYSN
jgi:hypothetical protein